MKASTEFVLPGDITTKNLKSIAVSKKRKETAIEEQVVNSIRRDLERLNWKFKLPTNKNSYPTLVPPEVLSLMPYSSLLIFFGFLLLLTFQMELHPCFY
jgi:hypothetical protein